MRIQEAKEILRDAGYSFERSALEAGEENFMERRIKKFNEGETSSDFNVVRDFPEIYKKAYKIKGMIEEIEALKQPRKAHRDSYLWMGCEEALKGIDKIFYYTKDFGEWAVTDKNMYTTLKRLETRRKNEEKRQQEEE